MRPVHRDSMSPHRVVRDKLSRMATNRDDELGRTATAPGAGASAAVEVPLSDTFGRFKLERELGQGGMGVVHAAFDPDLERRVALKVLRRAAYDDEASARLRREAKAMARLAHPNVVAVHEVGQVDGRDYVAMELVDGGTLADWLRDKHRRPREIVAAFLAAGRGLAAAHAAGLVHRDFKPHNVLRRRDGRIVVTDFGLARGVDAIDPTVQTVDVRGATTPSALGALTATGSLLGTPAYMAPEQWQGGVVGPAADQFAFCVALWEALTSERPFRGETLDELKADVARGAAALDAAKLPRRLRAPLRRGLDPDPKKRWPSMDALLDELARGERAPTLAVAAIGLAIVAGVVLYLALARGGGAACEAPARELASVWPADAGKLLVAAGRGELAAAFDRDSAAWRAGRDAACAMPRERRAQRLACLDGTLARLDAVRRAMERLPGNPAVDAAAAMLVDPDVCARATTAPRLAIVPTEDTIAALALVIRGSQPDARAAGEEAVALANKPGIDPCARALALLAIDPEGKDVPKRRTAYNDAVSAAEQCGDDRVRADALITLAPLLAEQPMIGARGEDAIKRAQIAAERVAQPDLQGRIDMLRADAESQHDRTPEALALFARAADEFAARGLRRQQARAVVSAIVIQMQTGSRADLIGVRATIAKWRPIVAQFKDKQLTRAFDGADAYARYTLGDAAGGHAEMVRLWQTDEREDPGPNARRIEGTVTDRDGHPIAGATVAAGHIVFGDSIGIPFPLNDGTDLRVATSDAAGHFAIPDAVTSGAVVAQSGALRSPPEPMADKVTLVVEPTRRLEGRVVTTDKKLLGRVYVMVEPIDVKIDSYRFVGPVNEDGTFSLDGAPIGRLQIGAAVSSHGTSRVENIQVPASTATTSGLELPLATTARTLDVVARSSVSTPLDSAQVVLFDGRQAIGNVAELLARVQLGGMQVGWARPVVGERAPRAAIAMVRQGDLVAHFADVSAGEHTACAIAINGDLTDPKTWQKIAAHRNELQLKCDVVAPDANAIVIEAPPQKRFD
jgi:hypothetical protein